MVISYPNSNEKLTKSESNIWSLFVPVHMQSLPKSKLGKVGVGSNIAGQIDQHLYYVKLESVRKLLRITRLAHKKSYLVIICRNSLQKLTKTEIG